MQEGNLNGTRLDTAINNSPTDFIRNGRYDYSSGNIGDRNNGGWYWESRTVSIINAWNLGFNYSTYLYTQLESPGQKGLGKSIRCLVR